MDCLGYRQQIIFVELFPAAQRNGVVRLCIHIALTVLPHKVVPELGTRPGRGSVSTGRMTSGIGRQWREPGFQTARGAVFGLSSGGSRVNLDCTCNAKAAHDALRHVALCCPVADYCWERLSEESR